VKILCLADTHGFHVELPEDWFPLADVLVCAGDVSVGGTELEIANFLCWFNGLAYEHKIFIAGNHDFLFQTKPEQARRLIPDDIIYLEDSFCIIDGAKVYGSPWTLTFLDWAFMLDRGGPMRATWERIPKDTDILITHGPPYGIRDFSKYQNGHAGCEELLKVVQAMPLKCYVFGHVHESYGAYSNGETFFANAFIVNEIYKVTNKPVLVEI
jgi:predicted phosphohydrolase